jgi:N-acetylglucosaminyl-diphospho-decaprenol L-rhamnosyltransferase
MYMASVAITIVGYRNADDIAECLQSLASAEAEPSFEIFISENGGAVGMDALIGRLDGGDPSWRPTTKPPPTAAENMKRSRNYVLIRPDGGEGALVHVAEMRENLGYAGGINAWLRPLLHVSGWEAVWVLNPDTRPEPDALAELGAYAGSRGKEMVGSSIIRIGQSDTVFVRGLSWNKLSARVVAVGQGERLAAEPDLNKVEAQITAPSGASIYVTRHLLDSIGLMDERYFLYMEELEWGERARGMVGHAHLSRVPHKCGTTIGGSHGRVGNSRLSVYLSTRNVILFVRSKHPLWLPWTLLMQIAHLGVYGVLGAFSNMRAGFMGLAAGLNGEVGRPDRFLDMNSER